ncbi:MAG TPA: ATP phosphoribosyltransferase regulatory subunit, partial [Polyangiaceae bacterium]|nr:ATP phosphoribosyltransferase regulatory subunit [Polyangiaceae bacterium]
MSKVARSPSLPPVPSDAGVGALEYPLPSGLRDLLPQEAAEQSRASRSVMEAFELCGYQRVSVPAFELADVLQRWMGEQDANSLLRFVDPESGEVVALRPDMTPQIARLVATRLRAAPGPVRLCYQGSVLRRRHERARTKRQIQQLGFELIGTQAESGDLEVLETATAAVRAAGLTEFTLDIGHAAITTALVDAAAPSDRLALVEALSMKDTTQVESAAARAGLSPAIKKALAALPDLHGGDEVWPKAERALKGTAAEQACAELKRIWNWVKERQLATSSIVDLGEIRSLNYYTGLTFHILAHGPGEPVGSGGRYDHLFEQFGAGRPAAGFAVDLGNLCWAVNDCGEPRAARKRVLLVRSAAGAAELFTQLQQELRAGGLSCAV